VAALAVTLSSCESPLAVRDFARAAHEVTLQFPALADDFAGSCVRRKLAEQKAGEITDPGGPASAACREDYDLAPALAGSMNVLANYLHALDRLASNETVQCDKEIDTFAASLTASSKLPAAAVGAVQGLAKFLAGAVGGRYQRRKLEEAVRAADADVAALTSAFEHIAGVEYRRSLGNEEESLRLRYDDAIQSSEHNAAIALLLQRQWREDYERLQKRKAAAVAFAQALARIREGHAQLARRGEGWPARELAKALGPYTASLQALSGRIRGAF
jgi:hypothetical protein